MATGSGIIRKVSGKVGDLVYRVQNGQQVIAAYNPHVKNPQTALQMQQRTKWLNVLAMYKVMKPYLKGAFENKSSGQNDYNRFMGINLQAAPVYLTRAQFVDGGAIIAPYLISQGSLPAITLTGSTTDIVANFTGAATVAEASASILGDARFKQGDALCFFVVAQSVSAEGTPVAQAYAMKLTLDLTDTTPLSSLCTAQLGIAATGGFVSVTTNSEVYATAVVHTRRTEKLLVSSARLQVTGDIGILLSDSTFAASATSLGYTEGDIFLEPDSTVPITGNGPGSTGGTEEDDDTGSSGTGNNNSSGEDSNPL